MWSSLTIRRLFWLVDGAIVACTVLLAVKIFNGLFAPPPPVPPLPITVTEAPDPASNTLEIKPAEYYAAMSDRGIFGGAGVSSSAEPTKPAPTSLDALPATSLTLTLLGIAVGTDGWGRAVIANEANKSVAVYKEGDNISTATTVERILPKKVVLNRNGKREVLTYSVMQKAPPTAPAPRPTLSRRPPTDRTSPGRPSYTMVERNEWKQFEGRDPAELLEESEARITPAWRDGRVEGLQLENIGENEYAKRLGLEEGDIVKSVNGVQIRSLDEAFNLATKLQKAPVIRVEVTRGGEPQTLTYRLR